MTAEPPAQPSDGGPQNGPAHMSPDEFRRLGHRMVDFVADYMARVGEWPVRSRVEPGEVARALPPAAPESPGGEGEWDAIFGDLERTILPGLTHWQSPSFFAYFPCNHSGPAILGELASAGLNVNGMLWSTSPAATELETRVLDWCARLIGLPDALLSTSIDGSGRAGGGAIQGTASESTLISLLAARARAREAGADPSALVAYASTQAHSSVMKAAMIAGLVAGPEDFSRVRLVETDDALRMDPARLGALAREDARAGLVPFWVCATAGTTSSGAFDPIGEVALAVREHAPDAWVHVDAAWAGAACVCPEHRAMLEGVEHADSLCMNPHKWLLTNFDCDLFWTRDRAALVRALSVTPEYLRNDATDSGAVIDYRDWQIPLGRRFRALKLWFVLRHYGAEGLRAYIRGHVAMAAAFEAMVRADERFELCAPRSLALVCFRPKGSDARARALMERVNATGRAFLTHTTLPVPGGGQRLVLRMAIGSAHTTMAHVDEAWALIRRELGAMGEG